MLASTCVGSMCSFDGSSQCDRVVVVVISEHLDGLEEVGSIVKEAVQFWDEGGEGG